MSKPNYIGRFAPSPSGSLHFGSLLTALASYLDAKSRQGLWLLRIDDIDPPRQQASATDKILTTLDALGLHWDGSVIFQSQRYPAYVAFCEQLVNADLVYPCYCTRKKLAQDPHYPGYCRKILTWNEKQNLVKDLKSCAELVAPFPDSKTLKIHLNNYALRLNCYSDHQEDVTFEDILQGKIIAEGQLADFIIFRRDSLPAYMLACAFDDAVDHITHIVRGSDLLESTLPQLLLQKRFHQLANKPGPAVLPRYAHLPVITNEWGQKLSKQNHAPEINISQAPELLVKALSALGQHPPRQLFSESSSLILQWGLEHWNPDNIPKTASIAFNDIA